MPDISVLRLLDANANRAREALRVMEDAARFLLDDQPTCLALKEIRHELTALVPADAMLCRDTPGDVGTGNTTAAEAIRQDIPAIITAAGKRLGEALRAIEEFLKTLSPDDARRAEALRYRAYAIEQTLSRALRPAGRFAEVRLYVLITESACHLPWLETAHQAILGGADCLQLREKDLAGAELLNRACQLVQLCHRHGVLCIINDRPDIALLSKADGVHLGQDDLPAVEARKLLGGDKIIGVSTHCMEHARAAVRDGADYLGVGPFFKSATKPRDFVAGPGYAREVCAAVRLPLVAIAGITEENLGQALACGIRAIAVTAAVTAAADPQSAARRLKDQLAGQVVV
jgi:thiamine-phosphate pyrophosphorylase